MSLTMTPANYLLKAVTSRAISGVTTTDSAGLHAKRNRIRGSLPPSSIAFFESCNYFVISRNVMNIPCAFRESDSKSCFNRYCEKIIFIYFPVEQLVALITPL